MRQFFVKKPVEVAAAQWDGVNREPIRELADTHIEDQGLSFSDDGGFTLVTPNGRLKINPGDWIIRGMDGELYPCTDERFRGLFEPAPAEEGNAA